MPTCPEPDRPVLLAGPLGALPAAYIQCLLAGAELDDDVAELLNSEHWRLVRMDTGHWPMFSQPRELAQILLDACPRPPSGVNSSQ